MTHQLQPGRYAIAYNVRGFGKRRKWVRVRIESVDTSARVAWVRTADIADAGTPLVLDFDKLEVEDEYDE